MFLDEYRASSLEARDPGPVVFIVPLCSEFFLEEQGVGGITPKIENRSEGAPARDDLSERVTVCREALGEACARNVPPGRRLVLGPLYRAGGGAACKRGVVEDHVELVGAAASGGPEDDSMLDEMDTPDPAGDAVA